MKIIVVSGGFDPLHSGHIAYFNDAKSKGDKLVVALNSDKWLINKKGKFFMPFSERKNILENINNVDLVIDFKDDDQGSAINAIKKVQKMYPKSNIVFSNGGDRNKTNIPGKIVTVEYDPNRSAFISLVHYNDGDKRYIISPLKAKVGDVINSGKDSEIKPGNTLPIYLIPVGSNIHNIEISPKSGGKLVRSAGVFAVITGRQEKYVTVKLPSGQVRLINNNCLATIGQIGNTDNRNIVLGKAGAKRWIRKRSKVRGSCMNACDHPHGGGEGRAPVGQASPRSPWGKPTLGYKTRKKNKKSNKYILKVK